MIRLLTCRSQSGFHQQQTWEVRLFRWLLWSQERKQDWRGGRGLLGISHKSSLILAAMAETDVSYASVLFRSDGHSPSRAHEAEETLYDEVRVENGHHGDVKGGQSKTRDRDVEDSRKAADDIAPNPKEARCRHPCLLLACCAILLCVTLMLAIMAVFFYQKTVSSTPAEKQECTSDGGNATQGIQQLSAKIAQLEKDKKNLTRQVQTMMADWDKFNVSRAQWAVDAYCPGENGSRQCNACQPGWIPFESNCHLINNTQNKHRKTWEDARQSCKDQHSDLAVIENQEHMDFIKYKSWGSSGSSGYWVGLRVEGGGWKWVDGREATKDWIPRSGVSDQFCAISVMTDGLKAVGCTEKQQWICQKTALSL
ncbi:C-type lectin domain family 9 member A isoform X3 [Nerophis ophidion]|nr:C-type lectin domain family 9 member A isoform X3 [Nerophis ophidion]